ncbi:pyridoxamine 5'-phosphate oxidase family protein [Mycolicibacterium lutetiense]|uniref:Nitroimidazol reductase NimA-like FMN-containing flavoprotein (Pyridoxamine 5'-phosphate oxidase superfamily) n=1 Tax=Mycolicibacterium lutetiense TaxID=1641992 RepID=A0ABS4ZM80_9MYCO|nr:pyridoxamine 5'-phosphate oxidase family protein [Mycolicibacterium lutetiense]MBP2450316.1 nitroimidazol reductase NimA-like FMN-containing flavoprotein (pyridoxamine 5'-phosphate oxidase superfamily) [Mycolicibacterium lutetiense]
MKQIRREHQLARTDRAALDSVLDAAAVGTLATVVDGQPWIVPMLYARDGDRVVLHGSTGAGALRHVAAGAPAGFCVTLLDGIVVANTLFDSTANYRSAVVRGHLTVIDPRDAAYALDLMSDSLIPGRSSEVRSNTKRELAATLAIALPITPDGWTVKVRDAPPPPPDDEADSGGWAGVVPLRTVAGDPIPAPWVSADIEAPKSVHRLVNGT